MSKFKVGDAVEVNKGSWASFSSLPSPLFYGLDYNKSYTVEAIYEEDQCIRLKGFSRVFHESLFSNTGNQTEENTIAKPILEERKKDKIRMELVDQGFPLALLELAKVMTWANENKGYKDHDWKNIPNAENAFKGAAARHRVKFDAQRSFGNEMLDCTDEESGIIHLAHEAFNVLALLELALVGKVK